MREMMTTIGLVERMMGQAQLVLDLHCEGTLDNGSRDTVFDLVAGCRQNIRDTTAAIDLLFQED